ncbi:hypothetical protein DNTS_002668 [Danionella cerebrum]|uniref:DBB domain-containing protein n=1 Tax=Danionella cerebrum TaxID=2873325 RepID=A0A553QLF2_9TELE|nr:hypothetical protein DNTS_002668 [Danionella translucida]
MCEVLIAHSSEAREWAEYLQQILVTSCSFQEDSIIFHDVNEEIWMKNTELFASSKCIILMLTSAFVDVQVTPGKLNTFWELLHPPHRVVAFLCGVSEEHISVDYFEHWEDWRKISSEDEPHVYVSTILECIDQGSIHGHHCENPYEIEPEEHTPNISEALDFRSEQELHQEDEDHDQGEEDASSFQQRPSDEDQTYFIVQPERILCGSRVNIYIMMLRKCGVEGNFEVEFHGQKSTLQRVPGSLLNHCIVTVQSPDMPAGKVSLTVYENQCVIYSTTVSYFTEMEQISRYLERAVDPMQFMCQAFDITSDVPDSLDNLLADSLEDRIPLNALEVFGNSQIAQNTSTDPCDVELPTLLHFSAKYGLKKLTSLLLRCPGALQAYSVINRDGDYPNQLAEKSGFPALRYLIDEYVRRADTVKSKTEESGNATECEDVYEDMLRDSQKFICNFDNEDIYECMMKLNPEMGLAQPSKSVAALDPNQTSDGLPEMDDENYHDLGFNVDIYGGIEEEDPYNHCCPDQIYDTVEAHSCPEVINRPPAPIPRPSNLPELEESTTYISKVFSLKQPLYSETQYPERHSSLAPVRLVSDTDMSRYHDSFAGMNTPGQRQLISLQERVKVGELTVEEAVQEFKGWKLNQEKRLHSIRFQQLHITAPMQTYSQWGSQVNCPVYEPTPHSSALPQKSASQDPRRRSWQRESTSSSSSSSSHRLSVQSIVSNSSGVDAEYEESRDFKRALHLQSDPYCSSDGSTEAHPPSTYTQKDLVMPAVILIYSALSLLAFRDMRLCLN